MRNPRQRSPPAHLQRGNQQRHANADAKHKEACEDRQRAAQGGDWVRSRVLLVSRVCAWRTTCVCLMPPASCCMHTCRTRTRWCIYAHDMVCLWAARRCGGCAGHIMQVRACNPPPSPMSHTLTFTTDAHAAYATCRLNLCQHPSLLAPCQGQQQLRPSAAATPPVHDVGSWGGWGFGAAAAVSGGRLVMG